MKNIHKVNENIYITSDEEIKEGDWYYFFENITKCGKDERTFSPNCKKIILTTDQDLIKDGVQKINDDEFLEWFVQNPSCKEVEVVFNNRGITGTEKILKIFGEYKIIIPQEEPKQETLEEFINSQPKLGTKEFNDLASAFFGGNPKQETPEEAAERTNPVIIRSTPFGSKYEWVPKKERKQFIEGAKWQQEQDKKLYSEDEILNLMYYIRCNAIENECGWQINGENLTDKELLKKFKNK